MSLRSMHDDYLDPDRHLWPVEMPEPTDGPWTLYEGTDEEGASTGLEVRAGDTTICRMPGIGHQDYSNAYALAAAPRLLDAVRDLAHALEDCIRNAGRIRGHAETLRSAQAILRDINNG